jgi:hypothetical protein
MFYLRRYLGLLMRRLWGFLQGQSVIFPALVLLGGFAVQSFTGQLNRESIRSNAIGSFLPTIIAVALILLCTIVLAARDLNNELAAERRKRSGLWVPTGSHEDWPEVFFPGLIMGACFSGAVVSIVVLTFWVAYPLPRWPPLAVLAPPQPPPVAFSAPVPVQPPERLAKAGSVPTVPEGPVLMLECNIKALPVEYGADSSIYVLDLQTLHGGLGTFFTTVASPPKNYWPSKDSVGTYAYRCDAQNYSESPVFAVSMTFVATMLYTSKDDAGAIRGDGNRPTGTRDLSVELDKIEAHGGKFTFYVWNGTGQVAQVAAPTVATIELANSSERVQVPLKQPSRFPQVLHLMPLKERVQ